MNGGYGTSVETQKSDQYKNLKTKITTMKTKFDFLTPENGSKVKGGNGINVEFCAKYEIVQCATIEAEYCGPAAAAKHEIKGPVNPWDTQR